MDHRALRVLVCLVFFPTVTLVTHARVYTTRPGKSGSLDHPESFGAREIYGGRFRINGHLAEMQLLAGSASVMDTLRMLTPSTEDDQGNLRYRASEGTVVGSWGHGASEKRFLMTSVGAAHSCLVFILKNNSGFFSQSAAAIPWPASLPVLDPLQQPQLVVEHLDTNFIFASVLLPQTRVDRALQTSREQMAGAGWEVEPLTEKTAAGMADSGFAVLVKTGKTCWLEARPGSLPNQSLVTLLCKKP